MKKKMPIGMAVVFFIIAAAFTGCDLTGETLTPPEEETEDELSASTYSQAVEILGYLTIFPVRPEAEGFELIDTENGFLMSFTDADLFGLLLNGSLEFLFVSADEDTGLEEYSLVFDMTFDDDSGNRNTLTGTLNVKFLVSLPMNLHFSDDPPASGTLYVNGKEFDGSEMYIQATGFILGVVEIMMDIKANFNYYGSSTPPPGISFSTNEDETVITMIYDDVYGMGGGGSFVIDQTDPLDVGITGGIQSVQEINGGTLSYSVDLRIEYRDDGTSVTSGSFTANGILHSLDLF